MPSRLLPLTILAWAVLAPACRATTRPIAIPTPIPTALRPIDQGAPGHVYTGDLPRPSPQLRYPAPRELPDPSPAASGRNWSELVHAVARDAGRPRRDSVLLVRGSSLASPRWVPCGDKPRAVLVDLEAVVGTGRHVSGAVGAALAAVETIGVTVVYATNRTEPDRPPVLAALTRARLRAPVPGETLLPMLPGRGAATRVAAGERWCVVAVAGDQADDFPGGVLVRHDGWFLVPRAETD